MAGMPSVEVKSVRWKELQVIELALMLCMKTPAWLQPPRPPLAVLSHHLQA